MATLVALSAGVLGLLLRQGDSLTGGYGLYPEDQLQFYAWIRDASQHWLAGNSFDLLPGRRTFLHPAFFLSGLLHRTGLSVPLSYVVWQPVAIVLAPVAFVAYARRLLPMGGQQASALVLALFAVLPLAPLLGRLDQFGPGGLTSLDSLSDEVWPAGYVWGYPVGLIEVALLPLVLLAVEAWRERRARGMLWLAIGGSLLVSWLHPWQGATLTLVIVGAELLSFAQRDKRQTVGFALILAAFALPAVYYLLLSRFDPVWRRYSEANTTGGHLWWETAATLLPLALPAALAYRLPAPTWQDRAVRLWPVAALLVYVAPLGTYPLHALDGVTLPLAVLAVQGVAHVWPRLRSGVVVAVLALATVPGIAHQLNRLEQQIADRRHPYLLASDERRALAWLDHDRRRGGVLATASTGAVVPYLTGRETYVGHDSWSPDFARRAGRVEALFDGDLGALEGRAFVRATRARFVLEDCRHRRELRAILRPSLAVVHGFGCARIYVLRIRQSQARSALPDARPLEPNSRGAGSASRLIGRALPGAVRSPPARRRAR